MCDDNIQLDDVPLAYARPFTGETTGLQASTSFTRLRDARICWLGGYGRLVFFHSELTKGADGRSEDKLKGLGWYCRDGTI